MNFALAILVALCSWGGPATRECQTVCVAKCCVPGSLPAACLQADQVQFGNRNDVVVLRGKPVALQPGDDSQRRIIVRRVAPGTEVKPPAGTHPRAADDADEDVIVQQAPAQWIGVRLAPIPEALAAHIGKAGVMVANVAKGSPADTAGLERYDVIVAFDGQKVDDGQDLMQAVGGSKAGTASKLELIRGGQKQKLSITPAKRPESDNVEYKYEEPAQDVLMQPQMQGHVLRMGPGGNWIMEQVRLVPPANN